MTKDPVFQKFARIAAWGAGYFVRSARRDDLAAGRPAFGADVDDVVGDLNHVEVVFDDDDRIAAVDEFVQHVEQQADVLEMEPRRRFVEDVERTPRIALGQLGGELDTLARRPRASYRAVRA